MSKNRTNPASSYLPPVAQLLALGQPGGRAEDERYWNWRGVPLQDYTALGIGPEHADELLRLMMDRPLIEADDPEYFGPVHAARALAWFKVERALPHMIELFRRLVRLNHDGWLEDLPAVLSAVGAEAIPHVARALRDQRESFGVRLHLTEALERIAQHHPEARPQVMECFTNILTYARYTDPAIIGHAVCSLLELGAVELLPAIEAAYEGGFVEEQCCGPFEEVKEEMLMTPEERKAKRERVRAEISAKYNDYLPADLDEDEEE